MRLHLRDRGHQHWCKGQCSLLSFLPCRVEHLVKYRSLIEDFVNWCKVDFPRARPSALPVSIDGNDVEVTIFMYLGLHLDTKLDWLVNIDALYKKGLSRLNFLRKLGFFNICSKFLFMFYQSVVSSPMFSSVCWCPGEAASRREMPTDKLDKLWRKLALYISGWEKDPEQVAVQWSTLNLH